MEPPEMLCPHCHRKIIGEFRPYQGGERRHYPRVCPHCNRNWRRPTHYAKRDGKALDTMKPNQDLGPREGTRP